MKIVISGRDEYGKYFEREVGYCKVDTMLLVRDIDKINDDGTCK